MMMAKARRHLFRRTVLLLLFLTTLPSANSEVCSSLDGPYCSFLNRRPVPAIAGELAREEKRLKSFTLENLESLPENVRAAVAMLAGRLSEQLSSILDQNKAESAQQPGEAKLKAAIVGEFEVSGTWSPPKLVLKPGRWVNRLPGWVTVGVEGEIRADGNLHGYIMGTDGYVLDGCTELRLGRDDAGGPGPQGVWTGSYSCHGVETNLILTLQSEGSLGSDGRPPVQVQGTFRFSTKPSTNSKVGPSVEDPADIFQALNTQIKAMKRKKALEHGEGEGDGTEKGKPVKLSFVVLDRDGNARELSEFAEDELQRLDKEELKNIDQNSINEVIKELFGSESDVLAALKETAANTPHHEIPPERQDHDDDPYGNYDYVEAESTDGGTAHDASPDPFDPFDYNQLRDEDIAGENDGIYEGDDEEPYYDSDELL